MAIVVAAKARVSCLKSAAAMAVAGVSLAACATAPHSTGLGHGVAQARPDAGRYKVGKPYQVKGVWYTPAEQPGYDEVGIGSWYGEQFHNRYTASGEVFDMDRLSAAHKTLPLPSLVEVTNLANGKTAVLRVNDRGPFVEGRIIDLSKAAAEKLGYDRQGVARVRVRYVGRAPLLPADGKLYQAAAPPPRPAPPALRPTMAAAAQPRAIPAPPSGWLTTPQFLPDTGPPPAARAIARAAAAEPVYAPRPAQAAAPGVEGFRIQAGAFADRGNAERAAARLAGAGRAEIVEIDRDGGRLYRVVVSGDGEPLQVRDRVAALGFEQALVIPGR